MSVGFGLTGQGKMRYRYFDSRFILLTAVILVTVFACVSRSVPEQRYAESALVAGPSRELTVPDPDHFSFAIVGDLHIGGSQTDRLRTILNAAKSEGDAFFCPLGDIVDKGEKESVDAFRKALVDTGWEGLTFPVIGNHDIFANGWQFYKDSNGPSHYGFTVGNSRFLAIDTADGGVSDSEKEWLKDELKRSGNFAHRFILSHYLPVVPGQRTYLKLANETESVQLMKLATATQVTGWLGGHYHSYLRGDVEGVTYVVAGGGGGRRMAPVESFFFVQVKVDGANVTYTLRPIN